ncbi:MAG: pyridoxal-phosphate dependent enzyme [Candidatus Binatota bacterium]|nr:pyridoxal-phosphate dependent enzyme [Candidatus Binatota bacterium]
MPTSRHTCATTVLVRSIFATTTTGSNKPSAATKSPRGRITCASIAIGDPADGYDVIHTVRDTGGWGWSATDVEIVDSIILLARTEGIFTEPAGGTEVAVTKKLIDQGRIPRDESIVISITGNGYKNLEAVASSIKKPHGIAAELAQFDDLFRALTSASGAGMAGA